MTCIVALADGLGGVWMGGDRAGVDPLHQVTHIAAPKVFQKGEFLLGYTSSFRMGQLIQYRFEPPTIGDKPLDEYMATDFAEAVRTVLKEGGYTKVTDNREETGIFLVGVRGLVYFFDNDHNVHRPISGYAACGSGAWTALGSLFTTARLNLPIPAPERVQIALEAAAHLVATVEPPFDVICIEGAR